MEQMIRIGPFDGGMKPPFPMAINLLLVWKILIWFPEANLQV